MGYIILLLINMSFNSNFELELNIHLDEGIFLSDSIHNNIYSQKIQIENIDKSLDNINCYNKKAKQIINRMSSFFNKMDNSEKIEKDNKKNDSLIYISTTNQNNIQDNIIDETIINSKINHIKNISIEIGKSLEKQNNILDTIDLKIFNNKSKINKNIIQVKKLL